MKNLFNIKNLLFIFTASLILFNSCKEEEDFPRTRLFEPVLTSELYSEGNSIIVDLYKMDGAVSYIYEVSQDSFATVLYTIPSDTNYIVIDSSLVGEQLLWYSLYQVRVTALADEAKYNSLVSDLGNVRTEKYPSIMVTPDEYFVTDTRAKVAWTPAGDSVTNIKVYAGNDARLKTSLMEYEITSGERTVEQKIISGLNPETTYQIALYSGSNLRGWEQYTTRVAQASGPNVFDLTGIYNPDLLVDTLDDLPKDAIVFLEGGMTYNAGSYAFSKSVSFQKGYSFTADLPLIDCGDNFNIVDGSIITSISFSEIAFSGSHNDDYIFNIDVGGTIGSLSFESCKIHSLRGVTRMKDGAGKLSNFIINNCVVDSIRDYGILAVDKDTWKADDVTLENSTFSKCISFLISRTSTNSVTIESCTLCETPEAGRPIFRWRGADGSNDITKGLKINNSIWGPGWDLDADGTVSVKGSEGLPNTTVTITNVYATSDFAFASDEIASFPSTTYSGTAADLWVDPFATSKLDFNFKDESFDGKSTAGDPRWRITL